MISAQLLREIFLLWQQGADAQRNTGECDICPGVGPTRRVGQETQYWICGHCDRKFTLWKRHELATGELHTYVSAAAAYADGLAAHTEAAATLLQFSQQTPK